MKAKLCLPVCCGIALLAAVSTAHAQTAAGTMAFTVSMDQPNTHYYHVEFRCDGLKGDSQDFKMPVWMPGMYTIQDYAKNVINFKAADGTGKPLSFAKTAQFIWHVKTANAPQIVVSYDVYAFGRGVGSNFLDDKRGYIVGPGLYMHVAGMLNHPARVTFKPYAGWTSVANGLDPVPGMANTFTASDFDLLYDCPILLGNQERFEFEVKGVPHYLALEDVPKSVDRAKITGDLQKIVTTATQMMGDVPYKHYTFLLMGSAAGGVEHLTSAAMYFDGNSLTNPDGYRRWLSFAAHEYFHTFNVKRIRPIALGPFDYDHENYTTMLWVSEGFTSYYMDLIVRRAGLTTPEQYYKTLTDNISTYENNPGHLFQSAAESSIDTWHRGEDSANTTISYYNKGKAIGALVDFKIRSATNNQKSLDDVMRTVYKEYFQQKKRGFKDEEFREVCERIAGVPLPEIFDDYVATTKEVDYTKYFNLAGLKIDTELRAQPGAYLGADFGGGGRGGVGGGTAPAPGATAGNGASAASTSHLISRIEYGSPAAKAGLSAQDEILGIDGTPLGTRSVDELLKARKPGDKIKLLIGHHGDIREVEAVLGSKMQRTFKIEPVDNPTPLQSAILKDVLKN
jgi:predicted metalloprotease with PDZ domain